MLLLAPVVLIPVGCSRAYYRRTADAQSYEILEEKKQDPRWTVSDVDITPDPRSRFYDQYDLDSPPLPPDDPAAHQYMHCVDGMRGWKHWHERGDLAHVENPLWPTYLGGEAFCGPGSPLPSVSKLTLHDAIQLSLIHSREYQEQLENVYLSALALTFERYLFDVRPRGFLFEPSNQLFYQHQPENRSDLLLGPGGFGIRRLFPTGAQFIAELSNETIWMFSGSNQTRSATSLAYSLMQPLLAGASREIVLEDLTQAERNTLYVLRNFARFRKDFYVTIVTGNRAIPLPGSSNGGELAFLIQGARSPTVGFHFLLLRLQRVRNAQANVRSLQTSVRELEALAEAGRATSLDVTQLQSSLENSRSRLLSLQRRFEDELDRYKVQLGLPPDMEVEIGDSLLEPFQFINPKLSVLEDRIYEFVRQIAAARTDPGQKRLQDALSGLDELYNGVAKRFVEFDDDFRRLHRVVRKRMPALSDAEARELQASIAEDHRRFDEARLRFGTMPEQLRSLQKQLDRKTLPPDEQKEFVDNLQAVREELLRMVRELSGLGISLRVELIVLEPVELTPPEAVGLALQERLDLMNRRGFVMDARRRIEIAGDRLEATLDLVAEGELRTRPLSDNENPFDFNAKESVFRAGVRITTPLDRRAERNDFRAAQISYERSRRNYMTAEDQVKLNVRRRLRRVMALARIFEIERRALRVAARELDQAIEFAERPPQPGQPAGAGGQQGVNISRALSNILNAEDDLIETWVDYQSARLSLFRDMGTMQIGEDGIWRKAGDEPPGGDGGPSEPPAVSAPQDDEPGKVRISDLPIIPHQLQGLQRSTGS